MSDISSHVPWSQRSQTPKPEDLLTEEQVEKIINTIPDQVYRSFLVRHMHESERSAYAQGTARKEGPVPTTLQLFVLEPTKHGAYVRIKACLRWQDVVGLCERLDFYEVESVPSATCYVFVAGLDKPLIAAHGIDELMPVFLKVNGHE